MNSFTFPLFSSKKTIAMRKIKKMWAEKTLVSIQEKAFAIFSICIFLFSPLFSRAPANPSSR